MITPKYAHEQKLLAAAAWRKYDAARGNYLLCRNRSEKLKLQITSHCGLNNTLMVSYNQKNGG